MKDVNKQTVFLEEAVLFDHQLIDRITFDLIHINQGWDDERHDYNYSERSSYEAQDIIELFEQFKYYQVEWLTDRNKKRLRIRGVLFYRYFWETTDAHENIVRVVLDIPHQANGEGIVVTVFKK